MNRLAQAQEILSRATQEPSCPFLAAVPLDTRATLETQYPNPHDLPETQLQKIAAQHGFPTPVGANLLDPTTPPDGAKSLVFALPQNELELPKIDNVSLSSLTGRTQGFAPTVELDYL